MSRSEHLHREFIARVSEGRLPPPSTVDSRLGSDAFIALFNDQVSSRLLDIVSRRMARER
ncbi:MAG: hypothetical protein RIC38_04080 [Chromatocurvus sp.]